MNTARSSLAVLVGMSFAAVVAGCSQPGRHSDYRVLDKSWQPSAGAALSVRWSHEISPAGQGPYVPVEQAAPGIDSDQGRIYVGSARGALLGFERNRGRQFFEYNARTGLEAQPAVDGQRGELYAATVGGTVLALHADHPTKRWQAETGSPVSQPPVLSPDAVYVVTDGDAVVAISRADGSTLWRYHREPREGFAIAGHAGLTQVDGKLLTGFADGAVVALDASDGRVLWELDTSLDLEEVDPARRFTDVDTTPAVAGNLVYAASFSGGLYAIDLASGSLQQRHADLRGVTGLAASEDALVISSAEQGVVCLDLPGMTLRWRHRVERGNPGRARFGGDNVYVTESRGALLALALASGDETGRLETSHGITAPAALDAGAGYVFSNAGTLYAFAY